MTNIEIVLYAFCVAWVAVELRPRIRLLGRKPFNCVVCMSGWVALGLWLLAGGGEWWCALLVMCSAMTVAGLYGAIKMRYL